MKAVAKYLSPGGVIVNISSLAGKRGSANNSVYCASKFGVTGLTQALKLAKGIRVVAVCPVYVETPGVLKAPHQRSPAHGKCSGLFKKFTVEQAALRKLPTGENIRRVILASAASRPSQGNR